jgi:hypothetical protein
MRPGFASKLAPAASGVLRAGLLLAVAFTASCSNNDQVTAPATDLGVYGTVETVNHVPAPGAWVHVESDVDPLSPYTPHDFFSTVLAVSAGGFGIGPMPAGHYTILAGYAKALPSAGATFDSLVAYESVTITDPTSFRTPMRLTLRPPAYIVGRMITSTPWLKYVYAVGSGGAVSGSSVDPSGRFIIAGVPQGTWRLMAYDLSGASPRLDVTVAGVVTTFGHATRVDDIEVPSP